MVREILRKWFGLPEPRCETCEVLRARLEACDYERKELLNRLLNPIKEKEEPVDIKTLQPIVPQILPWSVRKQILEKEDRAAAQVMREKEKEIAESHIENLEKELGVENG